VYFKQFLHDAHGCASYVIASRSTREAIVVDPQADVEPYLELTRDRAYTITMVVDTHLHADHVSGNRALAARTGAALHLYRSADVDFDFIPLDDGDILAVGQVELRVVHTPGHREEAISLVITNQARSTAGSMVLSGDTLFVGDVGRPDFGGDEGAVAQWASIQALLGLPDWVEVFPAHFEGSCGKAMCGRPSSTIGFERRFNPVLQMRRDEFLAYASQPPARPLNMAAILATNQGRSSFVDPILGADNDPVRLTVQEAQEGLAERDLLIVDVREPSEYDQGHLPAAVSIPQAELCDRIDEIPRDRDVLVVCASGGRSRNAARFLAATGYHRVADLVGGTAAWRESGGTLQPVPPA
jgi:glyoxylase-like metal-dependent hydrolase (beta-lactamase superfamily II)/rhodanese-related sulfurtransferase